MNRKQRRSVNKEAKKEYKNILIKKGRAEDKLKEMGVLDAFEEIKEWKKYWFGYRLIKGPKIAPTTTYRFGTLMIRFNIENLFIAWFGYVLKIKDWTLRSKIKPKGSFFNYVFTFRKRKA